MAQSLKVLRKADFFLSLDGLSKSQRDYWRAVKNNAVASIAWGE